MHVSSSMFTTTALSVELNSLVANSITYIYFYNNIFRNYITHYKQIYTFNFINFGAIDVDNSHY